MLVETMLGCFSITGIIGFVLGLVCYNVALDFKKAFRAKNYIREIYWELTQVYKREFVNETLGFEFNPVEES